MLQKGTVRLYLDGDEAGNASYTPAAGSATAVIGAAHTQAAGQIERGFYGLMGYCAEFCAAITAERAKAYADAPPYLFAQGLFSLIYFTQDAPVELLSNEHLALYGGGGFCMEAGVTPMDTPAGIPLEMPQTEDPAWKTTSEEDQWAAKTIEQIAAQASVLAGLSSTETHPELVKNTFSAMRGSFAPAMTEMKATTGRASSDKALKLIGLSIGAAGLAWPTLMSGMKMKAALSLLKLSSMQLFLAKYWAYIVAALAVSGLILKAVSDAVAQRADDAQPDHPVPIPPPALDHLVVQSVCWNHNGNPATGSIHFHKGGDNLPISMVYPSVVGTIQGDCVLVPGQLAGAYLEVTLLFVTTRLNPYNGRLSVADVSAAAVFGAFTPTAFNVNANQTVTVRIPFARGALSNTRLELHRCNLQITNNGLLLANHAVNVYTLPAAPIAPWAAPLAAYAPAVPDYIRTEFLEAFLQLPASPANFCAHATQALNGSGFAYDTAGGGASHYIDMLNGGFKLSKFIRDHANRLVAPAPVLNCADCSVILYCACAAIGISLPRATMISPYGMMFDCNRVQSIGSVQWRFPFDPAGTAPRGGFSYHQFNVSVQPAPLPVNTPVYDACLKVDGGAFPSSPNNAKQPLLPMSLPAQERAVAAVTVMEPYAGQFYRERLVLNGQVCGLFPFVFDVPAISFALNALPPARLSAQESYGRWLLHVMEKAGIPAALAAEAEAVEPIWPLAASQQSVTEEGPGFLCRKAVWQDRSYTVFQHWQTAGCSEDFLLGAQLANISAPWREAPEAGVGHRCYVVLEKNYLFSRSGQVFYVYAEDGASAKDFAAALDMALTGNG